VRAGPVRRLGHGERVACRSLPRVTKSFTGSAATAEWNPRPGNGEMEVAPVDAKVVAGAVEDF